MKIRFESLPRIARVTLVVMFSIAIWMQCVYQSLDVTFINKPFEIAYDAPEEQAVEYVETYTGRLHAPYSIHHESNRKIMRFGVNKGIIIRYFEVYFDILYRGTSYDLYLEK